MGLLSEIIGISSIGKMALKILKKRAFKPYQIPLEKTLEKQDRMLNAKFNRMEKTEIGKKLGIHKGAKIQNLLLTDYDFYEPFYKKPSPEAFMYPLNEYMKIKTSGTAGKEKWFMLPRRKLVNSIRQTIIPIILAVFHDGEKITIEYGDNIYVNLGPAPFISGAIVDLDYREGKGPFNIVPNANLPFKDKVQYFILNHEKIEAAILHPTVLISQIMPSMRTSIKLKGLLMPDTPDLNIYKDEIERFTGVAPKTAYGSTETVAPSVPSVEHSLGFFFDMRRGIFEFIPVNKEEVTEEIVAVNEVKVGEIYRLIYTDFESELTKYDTKDSFQCIAKGDSILDTDYPVFKYHARLDKTISLSNFTRISEGELLKAFKEAKVPLIEFTTKVESEKGLEYLKIYLEQKSKRTTKDIEIAVHQQLYRMDKDYKDIVDFFEYTPVKIKLVPKGSFAEYLEGKTASYQKVDRIDMKQKEFNMFFEIIKRRTKPEHHS
jgi:hypothetical protein